MLRGFCLQATRKIRTPRTPLSTVRCVRKAKPVLRLQMVWLTLFLATKNDSPTCIRRYGYFDGRVFMSGNGISLEISIICNTFLCVNSINIIVCSSKCYISVFILLIWCSTCVGTSEASGANGAQSASRTISATPASVLDIGLDAAQPSEFDDTGGS